MIGDSLEVCLEYYEHELMELVAAAPAVVCCRSSPEQKAAVVRLIERHTGMVGLINTEPQLKQHLCCRVATKNLQRFPERLMKESIIKVEG